MSSGQKSSITKITSMLCIKTSKKPSTLLKLKGYGIQGKLLKWIVNFLKDRKQRVHVDGSSSEWAEVTSGIPRGSILGPLLFIYINDLPDVVHSFIKLFADDAKLYAVVNKPETQP